MMILTPSLTIADLLKGDIKLAAPPTTYLALKKIVDDPNKTAQDAVFVIESDAALAMRLLKVVNSAFYGFPSQVSSIAKAITLIGMHELQNLVLATIVIERFSDLPGQLVSIHDFWAKNLRCALIAKALDSHFGGKYPDTAFLCGLVHNIGQLVMYRRIPVLAREVDLLMLANVSADIDKADMEQQVIGFDRFQLGAELCRLWKLPDIVIESIGLHRYPDHVGRHADIAGLIRWADYYSCLDAPYDGIVANGLELSAPEISLILDKIHDEFEVIFKIFYPSK